MKGFEKDFRNRKDSIFGEEDCLKISYRLYIWGFMPRIFIIPSERNQKQQTVIV